MSGALLTGCVYVTGSSVDAKKIFCGKLPAEGSELCPKHVLMREERDAAEMRRLEKLRKDRIEREAARQAELHALETSPLAAVNPAAELEGRR